jgi:ATP-dependent DNA helicase RecQ
MTRAKETLALLKSGDRPNPFLFPLKGDQFLYRTLQPSGEVGDRPTFKRYEMLGLEDVYMDFAGCLPSAHSIHASLSAVQTGDKVDILPVGKGFEVRNGSGACIAKLSGKSSQRLVEKVEDIDTVSVLAMLQRDRGDPAEDFLPRIRAEKWEMPVLEIAYRERAA